MKTYRKIGAIALCAVLAPVFASCGGDDDDEPGNGGVVDVIDGQRLTSVNNVGFTYDEAGRLIRLGAPYYVEIDYSEGMIYSLDSDDEEGNMHVKFNGSGYISELSSKWDYTDKDDNCHYKGSGTMRFSYNGDGRLTKYEISTNETEKDLDDNSVSKFAEKIVTDYTWRNGNLVKAVTDESETEDGETDRCSMTYEYGYGDTVNRYLQVPMSIGGIIFDDSGYNLLAAAGMFGKGPDYLPETLRTDDDGDVRSYNLSYSLNANGTLRSESGMYRSYSYGYSAVTRAGVESSSRKTGASVRNIFVHRRHK